MKIFDFLSPAFAVKMFFIQMLLTASIFNHLDAQGVDTAKLDTQVTSFGFEIPTRDSCIAPTNILTAVVYTEREARAYLEFTSELPFNRVSIFDESSAQWLGDFHIEDGRLSLTNLETGKKYQLFTIDNCGKEVVIAEIDTKMEKKAVFPASSAFFAAMTEYVNNRFPEPLQDFLATNEKVSYIERLSYFQQHLMQGQPLEEFPAENSFPELQRNNLRGATCYCTFVVNTVEFAVPGTQILDITDNSQRQGHIVSQDIHSGVSWDNPKEDLNNGAQWWMYRRSKGPAYWQQLWSEGYKDGTNDQSKVINDLDQNNTNLSAHFAQLQYSFFCTNYANLPADCACDKKPISLDWRYDSRATAHAQLLPASWSKHAAAASQDVAVVTYEELGANHTIEILGSGTVKVKAECDKTVNPDFWVKAADVAGGIAVIVAGANGVFKLTATQITNLATSLGQVLGTPIYNSTGCDVDNESANVLTAGTTPYSGGKTLKPNIPIRVICSSFSNMEVLGKRSWFSWARIHSSFQINGAIKGGLLGNEQDYCCTKTIGNWVAASLESPDLTDQFEEMVGVHFSSYFFGLPVRPSGAILLQKEFGYITQNAHPGCNVIAV
jgi:hypothetical protein